MKWNNTTDKVPDNEELGTLFNIIINTCTNIYEVRYCKDSPFPEIIEMIGDDSKYLHRLTQDGFKTEGYLPLLSSREGLTTVWRYITEKEMMAFL